MAFRHKTLILAFATALSLCIVNDAGARGGGGASFGSRGTRSFSLPGATPTAPGGAAPLERSMNAPNSSAFQPRPSASTQNSVFSNGFGRGFLGGLLGAGLFGLLLGHGLFGGIGGAFSLLGLILQLGLLFLLFKLIMSFWRGPALATRSGSQSFSFNRAGLRPDGGFPGFGGSTGTAAEKLPITAADFSVFEQRLSAIENAFGAEDYDGLRALMTSEMASYFMEELAENAKKGVVNKISDVRFLHGDLAEAWRERQAEYATVAMRFSLIDTTEDRMSGRIVSGDLARPVEVTEVWTFIRRTGAGPDEWKLSAIQQAA